MAVYEEYLNYRLTGRCSNPFWQRNFGGVSGGGGDAGGDGGEPAELLSWEGVAYHINKGDYKDVYAIGDSVPLDLGSEGLIHMQVAAFDTDDLADGSGKAPMTFIAKELLKTKKRMNPAAVTGDDGVVQDGTGLAGGWEKSELRQYLQSTIQPMIPADVASMICAVSKTQVEVYNSVDQTTEDVVWIPDYGEFRFSSGIYYALLGATASRVKACYGATSASEWWLRGVGNISSFKAVMGGGNVQNMGPTYAYGVCLGFCTGRTPT